MSAALMAGVLAGAPLGVSSTRISSSAVLSASTQRHRLQTLASRDWRKNRSGLVPDHAVVAVSATLDHKVVSRREAISVSAAGLGAFLLVSGVSRAHGVSAAAEELWEEGAGPYSQDAGDLVVVFNSWQSWVKTWLV